MLVLCEGHSIPCPSLPRRHRMAEDKTDWAMSLQKEEDDKHMNMYEINRQNIKLPLPEI